MIIISQSPTVRFLGVGYLNVQGRYCRFFAFITSAPRMDSSERPNCSHQNRCCRQIKASLYLLEAASESLTEVTADGNVTAQPWDVCCKSIWSSWCWNNINSLSSVTAVIIASDLYLEPQVACASSGPSSPRMHGNRAANKSLLPWIDLLGIMSLDSNRKMRVRWFVR